MVLLLRDIRWLADAGKRLEMARAGIERAHGKDSLRLRLLQGGRYPELALWVISAYCLFFFPLKFSSYWDTIKSRLIIGCFFFTLYVGWIFVHRHLRLELLEGVVAFHSGQLEKSRQALASAKAKFVQVGWSIDAYCVKLSREKNNFYPCSCFSVSLFDHHDSW